MKGLDIDEKQFMKLSPAERDLCIYKNLKEMRASKFHLKVQYVWLFFLTLISGIKGFLDFNF